MLSLSQVVVLLRPLPHCEKVWETALAWSRATGSALHVLLAVQPAHVEGLDLGTGLAQLASRTAELEGERWLMDLVGGRLQAGDYVVHAGKQSYDAVLHEARRHNAGLVIAGAEDILGTGFHAFLKQMVCPLQVVRRGGAPQKLGAALAPVALDDDHDLIATVLLEHLLAFSRLFRADAAVLSALPNPVELTPLIGDSFSPAVMSPEVQSGLIARVQSLVDAAGLKGTAVHTLPGDVASAIPALAEDHQIDWLLLGLVRRSAFTEFWLGNTAESLLKDINCDALLLRPQDYYDPH